MPPWLRRCSIALLVGLVLLIPARPARADSIGKEVTLAVIGIVAGTAVITTAIILSIRHNPSITGCLRQGSEGLQMASEQDSQTYLLTGDTAGLKPGERVKVQGKRRGKDPTGSRHFFVEKFRKDYGPCNAAAATP